MTLPDETFDMAGQTDAPPEMSVITLEGTGSLTISQQRSVIIDELGNQELFWLRLSLPFQINPAVGLDNFDALTPSLRGQLAAEVGRLLLELLADHEQRTTSAMTTNESPVPEMAPGDDEIF